MPRKKPPKTSAQIAAEIDKTYTAARKQLLDSMKTTKIGTRSYLDHVKLLADLERKYRAERAERGLDPQNLGAATKTQYVYKAVVEVADAKPRTARELQIIASFEKDFPNDDVASLPTVQPETNEDESESE